MSYVKQEMLTIMEHLILIFNWGFMLFLFPYFANVPNALLANNLGFFRHDQVSHQLFWFYDKQQIDGSCHQTIWEIDSSKLDSKTSKYIW